jgi:hypothetical protein
MGIIDRAASRLDLIRVASQWPRWLLVERRYRTWGEFKMEENARLRAGRLASKYARQGFRYPHLKAFLETRD